MTAPLEEMLSDAMKPTGPVLVEDWTLIVEKAARRNRRDRSIQRFSVVGFLAAALLAVGNTRRGSGEAIAEPAQGGVPVDTGLPTTSEVHLAFAIIFLGALLATGLIATSRRSRSHERHSGWRRFWFAFTLPALLYGPILTLGVLTSESPMEINFLLAVASFLTWYTIPILPMLLVLVIQRIDDKPRRASIACGVWVVLGVGVISLTRAFVEHLSELEGGIRLWPVRGGQPNERALERSSMLEAGPRADWNPPTIFWTEVVFIVILGLVVSSLMVLLRRRSPMAAMSSIVIGYLIIAGYNAVAPLAFALDFDTYVGDVLLGSIFMDLTFFFVPTDFIAASAISAAMASMVWLLWLWGGPPPAKSRQQAQAQEP